MLLTSSEILPDNPFVLVGKMISYVKTFIRTLFRHCHHLYHVTHQNIHILCRVRRLEYGGIKF